MTEVQKQAIDEFRQYATEHGWNVDNMTDDNLYDTVARMTGTIRWGAEKIGKALREIMAAISKALKTKTEEDRQRHLYYRKKKSQQRNWSKRKRVRK